MHFKNLGIIGYFTVDCHLYRFKHRILQPPNFLVGCCQLYQRTCILLCPPNFYPSAVANFPYEEATQDYVAVVFTNV